MTNLPTPVLPYETKLLLNSFRQHLSYIPQCIKDAKKPTKNIDNDENQFVWPSLSS